MITVNQLVKLGALPINAQKYVKAINDTCIKYSINTEARICAFLCQIFEETGALSNVRIENLNYSAKRLMQVWPKRFPTLASTNGYVMNPKALAEKVYGGRGGNPAGKAGLYIGRGCMQLTFYDNYKACGKALGVDLINHPELVSEPEYAVLTAGWFWNEAKCNVKADLDSLEGVRLVTIKVNGAEGNLKMRQDYWLKAKKLGFNLKTDTVAPVIPTTSLKPLPNVVLNTETASEVTQHNPVIQEPSILGFILDLFKRK